MVAHLIDSAIYGDNWSTGFSRELFAERTRLARWLEVIKALARAQGSLGLIPERSVEAIGRLDAANLDIDRIAAETRATSHSTLGVIRELQRHLPESAQEHVYVGATVQDITDTSAVLEMAAISEQIWTGLRAIESTLLDLATTHRATAMIGRTHGQPGAPITFGFKAASWLDELGRSIERLGDLRRRALAAQLGGAVGSLAFFGDDALSLRRAFAAEIGLNEPATSWLTARDRLAEFGSTLAIATATLGRMANEVFTLQRAEVGELRETSSSSTVGSITMPHKLNPERSEQIVALARLVRTQSASLVETMVQEHERDARGWKAEWVILPTLCHYSCAAVELSQGLVEGLIVDVEAMLANIHSAGSASSEQLLIHASAAVGKHAAQSALHHVYQIVRNGQMPLDEALRDAGIDVPDDVLLTVETGACAQMADQAVKVAQTRRAAESKTWR